MGINKSDILTDVADYYSAKLAEHGATPRGVDWNGEKSQIVRFEQLSGIIKKHKGFSVNDLGCGYGALYDYLLIKYQGFFYTGCDVSSEMVLAARSRHADKRNAQFIVTAAPPEKADYGIASGIFNVRLGRSDAEWWDYFRDTLDMLDQTSRYGFSFNCLTAYSDAKMMRDYLYYADPCALFDLCKRRYSRNVALMHDYDLYEFTMMVRKER